MRPQQKSDLIAKIYIADSKLDEAEQIALTTYVRSNWFLSTYCYMIGAMILLKEAYLAEEFYDKSERIGERIKTVIEVFGKKHPSQFTTLYWDPVFAR